MVEDVARPARRTGAAAVLLASGIVAVAVLLAVALVVLVLLDDGWTRVIWAAVGALLLWQLVPRPQRAGVRAVPVPITEAPDVHRLLSEIAGATGARLPTAVVADTAYATALVPVGYLGRGILVLGLPQWAALDDGERVAVIAHELVCSGPARGPGGIVFRLADDLVTRLVLLLSPPGVVQPNEASRNHFDSSLGAAGAGDELAGDRMRREAAAAVGSAGLAVFAAPARALQRALRRAARPAAARGCLDADRVAASVVGSRAIESLLLSTLSVPRGWVAAEVAARRRGNPFDALAQADRPGVDELERRLSAAAGSGERTGARHAPTAARVQALRDHPTAAGGGMAPASVQAANADLTAYRERLLRQFTEELVHGRG